MNEGWALAKVTLGNERVSLSGGGALWGLGPTAGDLLDAGARTAAASTDPMLRQRLAALYIEAEILRLIRLRTVTRGASTARQPGAGGVGPQGRWPTSTASAIMGLAKDLRRRRAACSTDGRPARRPIPACGTTATCSRQALTIGGGTGDVQRNIIAERVLGLPHDIDVEVGLTWAEARRS